MSGRVLTLREYESAVIGDRWDPIKKVIPGRLVAEIEALQAGRRPKVFSITRRHIVAQNYVGTIGMGERAIDILPKIDRDDTQTRANLVHMLRVARLVPVAEAGLTGLEARASTILDAFMGVYVRRLAVEWRRGRIVSYRREDRNRSCLRGKLLFAGQIRHNLLHPERFFTRADEFVQDVPLSQLLKAGLHVCRTQSISNQIRQSAMELLAEFDGVSDISFSREEIHEITVDRRSARFGPLVELAKLLISGHTADVAGKKQVYSLAFDMNIVFERYIGQLLARVVCPPERVARLQVASRSLVLRQRTPKFLLKPDVAIYEKRRMVCLLDTKWKALDLSKPHEGVRQSDMYQMYAYGKEYGVPVVILLYPRHGDLERQVARYRYLPGGESSPRIDVCTVDVGRPPGRNATAEAAAQLREVLEACLH